MRRCFGNRASGPIRVHGDLQTESTPFLHSSLSRLMPYCKWYSVVTMGLSKEPPRLRTMYSWLMPPPVSSVDHNVWGNGSTPGHIVTQATP